MHFRSIGYVMGTLLIVTSIALLLPIITSIIFQEDDLFALIVTATATFADPDTRRKSR